MSRPLYCLPWALLRYRDHASTGRSTQEAASGAPTHARLLLCSLASPGALWTMSCCNGMCQPQFHDGVRDQLGRQTLHHTDARCRMDFLRWWPAGAFPTRYRCWRRHLGLSKIMYLLGADSISRLLVVGADTYSTCGHPLAKQRESQ